jgi:hypothetical protein
MHSYFHALLCEYKQSGSSHVSAGRQSMNHKKSRSLSETAFFNKILAVLCMDALMSRSTGMCESDVLLSQEGEPGKDEVCFVPANAQAVFGEGRSLSEARGPTHRTIVGFPPIRTLNFRA